VLKLSLKQLVEYILNRINVSLENLPTGIYFIQWSSKNGQRGCEKVVKN